MRSREKGNVSHVTVSGVWEGMKRCYMLRFLGVGGGREKVSHVTVSVVWGRREKISLVTVSEVWGEKGKCVGFWELEGLGRWCHM